MQEPTIYIIGCGGVGSWLIPKLRKLTDRIILVDGDRFEPKNMDRQLFDQTAIGMNKAEALGRKYNCPSVPEYFSTGSIESIRRGDILFCCADNHAARRAALQTCDMFGTRCVTGANEYTDAEAYWYEPEWRGTANDPRVVYPSMLTDNTGDPLRPRSCVGEAQEETPQLVLANDWASGLMLHLYWYHCREGRENGGAGRDVYPREFWPVHHRASFAKFLTIRYGDRKQFAAITNH